MVFNNTGPTTPVKGGRGRIVKPHRISVESPYFSPSKERPPRPKDENLLIDERRLQLMTTTKTDRLNSLQNYAPDPFEATQTQISASPSVAGLYLQLALCKPNLIQGVISFIALIIYELIYFKNASLTIHGNSL